MGPGAMDLKDIEPHELQRLISALAMQDPLIRKLNEQAMQQQETRAPMRKEGDGHDVPTEPAGR